MSSARDELEALFQEARASIRQAAEAKTVARERRLTKPVKVEPSQLFSRPENWYPGKCVALIHAPSQTLLGHFQELLHRTEAGCRRLVRLEYPASLAAVEYVTGEWGWQGPVQRDPRSADLVTKIVELFISLKAPEVSAQATVCITLQGVGILSVKLLEPISFAGTDGLLQLPADTNVLQVMTHESKLALRKVLDES